MNKTKKVLIVTLSLVAILSIFLTYKAYMNKPVVLDDIKYSENTINKKKFGIFVEKDSYSSESDKYEVYSGTTWPGSGYEFNSTLSTCVDENGETISNALSINNSTITLTSTKTAYCYVYFDKGIPWKYYGWNGSTLSDSFPASDHPYLRTSGTTALYSGINESDDIVQVCVKIGDNKMICISPNSYNNNDLEEQCVDVEENDIFYESNYGSNSEYKYCGYNEYYLQSETYGGAQFIYIYSNGNALIDSFDEVCKITGSGTASCYLD